MSESILCGDRVCYICGTPYNLHKHHVYGGYRRKNSEADGCWVYLCARHHNLSNDSVHMNPIMDRDLKWKCQQAWEARNGSREDFIHRFGRSYEQ